MKKDSKTAEKVWKRGLPVVLASAMVATGAFPAVGAQAATSVPATSVKISNPVSVLVVGDSYDINRTLTPSNSTDKTTFTSSDPSIAEPDAYGRFTVKKTGLVTITAKTTSGKKDKCSILVVSKYGVTSLQSRVNRMLAADNIKKMYIRDLQNEKSYTIPEGNYSDKKLWVRAPYSEVDNYGTFSFIKMYDIKNGTWKEHAKGNSFNFADANGAFQIMEGGQVDRLNLTAKKGAIRVILEGIVNTLRVMGDESKVNVKTDGTSKVMNVSGKQAEVVLEAEKDTKGKVETLNITGEKSKTTVGENATVETANVTKEAEVAVEGNMTTLEVSADNTQKVTLNTGEKAKLEKIQVTGDATIDLTANSGIKEIVLENKADVTITGNTEKLAIRATEKAEGAKIETTVPVEVSVGSKVDITLNKGAEGSKIEKTNSQVNVSVKNETEEKVTIGTEGSSQTESLSPGGSTSGGGSIGGGGSYLPTPPPTPATPEIQASFVKVNSPTSFAISVDVENPTIEVKKATETVTGVSINGTTITLTNPMEQGAKYQVTLKKDGYQDKTFEFTYSAYTATFDVSGGSSIANQTVYTGNKLTEPTAPTKSGYTFGGWYSDAGLTTAYTFGTELTADITLYAKWIQEELLSGDMTLTVEGTGTTGAAMRVGYTCTATDASIEVKVTPISGSGTTTTVTGSASETQLDISLIEKLGLNPDTFNGGTYSVTLEAKKGDATDSRTSEITIPKDIFTNKNAKPEVTDYAIITFESNGATTSSAISTQSVTKGAVATKPDTDPEKKGYTFNGWYLDGAAYDFTSPVTSNIKLVANWEAISYTITYKKGTAVVTPSGAATTYTIEDTVTLPALTVEDGNEFGGWYDNEACSGTAITTISKGTIGNLTFYAKVQKAAKKSEATFSISTSSDLFGKKATDLMDSVTLSAVSADGTYTPTGTLKYVSGYTSFSSIAAQQEGNYIALVITPDISTKDAITITAQDNKTGAETYTYTKDKLEEDGTLELVWRVEAGDVITFTCDWDGAGTEYGSTIYKVDLTGVTLEKSALGAVNEYVDKTTTASLESLTVDMITKAGITDVKAENLDSYRWSIAKHGKDFATKEELQTVITGVNEATSAVWDETNGLKLSANNKKLNEATCVVIDVSKQSITVTLPAVTATPSTVSAVTQSTAYTNYYVNPTNNRIYLGTKERDENAGNDTFSYAYFGNVTTGSSQSLKDLVYIPTEGASPVNAAQIQFVTGSSVKPLFGIYAMISSGVTGGVGNSNNIGATTPATIDAATARWEVFKTDEQQITVVQYEEGIYLCIKYTITEATEAKP